MNSKKAKTFPAIYIDWLKENKLYLVDRFKLKEGKVVEFELRYCKECKRETIQAGDSAYVVETYDKRRERVMDRPRWYCPQCGKKWVLLEKEEEYERKFN